MKQNFLAFLFMTLFVVSCKKDKTDPLPVEVELSRSFTYLINNATDDISYSGDAIRSSAIQISSNDELSLDFAVFMPKGKDVVTLLIPNSKIKTGYVGFYSIVPYGNTMQGDVKATYTYWIDTNTTSAYGEGKSDGRLNIDSYDAKNKTLTGSYSFQIDTSNDPKAPSTNRECIILLEGKFKNLPIKEQR